MKQMKIILSGKEKIGFHKMKSDLSLSCDYEIDEWEIFCFYKQYLPLTTCGISTPLFVVAIPTVNFSIRSLKTLTNSSTTCATSFSVHKISPPLIRSISSKIPLLYYII